MRILLFSILLFTSLLCSAQDRSRAAGKIDWVTGERDNIPKWVFEPQGDGRFVGISDPCIDSINGENQALLRAWFLSMIESGAEMKIMQESYQKSNQIATYDHGSYHFAQVAKFAPNKLNRIFKRGRSYTTIFGERIVEYYEVTNEDRGGRGEHHIVSTNQYSRITGEYVSYGTEVSVIRGNINSTLLIQASIDGGLHTISYDLSGGRESAKLMRSIDLMEVSSKERGRFWYEDITPSAPKRKAAEVEQREGRWPLVDGLWRGIYESLVDALVNDANYEFTIKHIEQSGDSNYSSLVRSVYNGTNSLHLQKMGLLENKIWAEWSNQAIK